MIDFCASRTSRFEFDAGSRGKNLEGVAPGEILVEVVVVAVRHLYRELLPKTEEWLRCAVAEYVSEDAAERTFPLLMIAEDDKVVASVRLVRIIGA